MRRLLDRLGNPHHGLPLVHVAGTKGKGSTSAMIAAVLKSAGYDVGLYTSPHLHGLEERFRVNGRPCKPDELIQLLQQIRPAVEAMDLEAAAEGPDGTGPTYFEITTAMALLHFVRRGVTAAVLEVGLGGRLDATNVCTPLVSVITSISFDHTQQLGNTLSAIAGEKAGIVKPGVPVVSGVVEPEPRDVIRETCQQRGSRLIERGTDFDFDYQPPRNVEGTPASGRIRYRTPHESGDYDLRLLGRHQAANAATALAALAELRRIGWRLPESSVHQALASLTWPGRVEVVARRPAVVVDAAHNVASIAALLDTLDESFTVDRRLLVFATTQDKDVRGMLTLLLGRFDEVFFTQYGINPRAVPPEELQSLAVELIGCRWPVYHEPAAAWVAARSKAKEDDMICVTGSFFIVAELKEGITKV
jgi:dihydrofolate synthase/folylpolyglutamate synthase